jgi:mannosyltransferase OCH1-like enzyme
MWTLYQTWKTKELPQHFQKNWNLWDLWCKKHNIKHVLLDDNDLREIVEKHYPRFLKEYDGFSINIERVDFARYVMMAIGGIYADLDTYPSDKNDPIKYINKAQIILGSEPIEHTQALYQRDLVLCNAFMISPQGNRDFWEKFMDFVIKNYEHNYRPVENTGPMALTRFYETFPLLFENVLITNACIFFPLTAKGKPSSKCRGLDDSFVVHEWSNSWTAKKPWEDPMIYNRRHWVYLLFIFFGMFILYLASKKSI